MHVWGNHFWTKHSFSPAAKVNKKASARVTSLTFKLGLHSRLKQSVASKPFVQEIIDGIVYNPVFVLVGSKVVKRGLNLVA